MADPGSAELGKVTPAGSSSTVARIDSSDSIAASKTASQQEPPFRIFNGAIRDAQKRFAHSASDWTDALNYRVLVTVIFMFFACIAPTITFGGLMGEYTEERMGITQTLISQCICGIIWSFFSCQPFIIQSATGPVLIFEKALYAMCKEMELDFLTVRFFAGFWILIICIIVVAFEGAWLLQYVTKFTEEIFALMISGIFISESIKFIARTNEDNPVEDYMYYEIDHHKNCSSTVERRPCHHSEPNTTLLTLVILILTFCLACSLRYVRTTMWFGKHVRNIFGDFGVAIAIATVALLMKLVFPHPVLPTVSMPLDFEWDKIVRLVKPGVGQDTSRILLSILVAGLAGFLVFILIFVETEITELLLSRKQRGLVKGTGINWDLVLVGITCMICSMFGLPWMCAAAVQSLAHCSSLTIMKKDKSNPGHLVIDRVIEQRATNLCVSLLIGAFGFFGRYIPIPKASLFGVFLYLGFMNLIGVDLVMRILLFFLPVKYHWDTPYTKTMKVWRIHFYTFLQIAFVIIILIVKAKVPIIFPFVLIIFVIFRRVAMPRIFNEHELDAIDGEAEETYNTAPEAALPTTDPEADSEVCSAVDISFAAVASAAPAIAAADVAR